MSVARITIIKTMLTIAEMIKNKDHRLDLAGDPHSDGWNYALLEVEHDVRQLARELSE